MSVRRSIPPKMRSAVFERDGRVCTYCGTEGWQLQIDHIVPVSRGGRNEMRNLTVACSWCNMQKFNRTPEEWIGMTVGSSTTEDGSLPT